ncbi:hypothetical protein KIPB_005420 [Kipferlia bialata]|uniref:Uncharacterized protein n=1 Tax=Kipferlia bialata TaxID=797122 RepID=A0A391NWA1_9EUKA|nr:hypothetical protein KIPB_005420 [Kipferlia bialata]|eukprot:g5420.t1
MNKGDQTEGEVDTYHRIVKEKDSDAPPSCPIALPSHFAPLDGGTTHPSAWGDSALDSELREERQTAASREMEREREAAMGARGRLLGQIERGAQLQSAEGEGK